MSWISLPISIIKLIDTDEVCVLAAFTFQKINNIKTLMAMTGLGERRSRSAIAQLKRAGFLMGKGSNPENLSITAKCIPNIDDEIGIMPLDVFTSKKFFGQNFFEREKRNARTVDRALYLLIHRDGRGFIEISSGEAAKILKISSRSVRLAIINLERLGLLKAKLLPNKRYSFSKS